MSPPSLPASALLLLLITSSSRALDLSLRIQESLEADTGHLLEASAMGFENCGYKCSLQWNQKNNWNPRNGFYLDEYAACLDGCNSCASGTSPTCQHHCKETKWTTYLYTFNLAKELVQISNGHLPNTKALHDCIDNCPIAPPGTSKKKHGKLNRKYKKCTKKCFTKYLAKSQDESIDLCRSGARDNSNSALNCSYTETNCYVKENCGFGLSKGLIEPDKACIQGCSQNLCQNGADCTGNGFYSSGGGGGCQLITPQMQGEAFTVRPNMYGEQSDQGECCAAAFERCIYSPGMGPEAFGVSLGHVIATEDCKDPSSTKQNLVIKGDILEAKENDYKCKCQNFLTVCPREADIAVGSLCYGIDGVWQLTSTGMTQIEAPAVV